MWCVLMHAEDLLRTYFPWKKGGEDADDENRTPNNSLGVPKE